MKKRADDAAADQALEPTPADPFAHVGDPHWGRGGSYEIDPLTRRRVPAEQSPAAMPPTDNQE